MPSEIESAIRQICEEKNLSYEAVIATIESALAAAYRKDFGQKNQNIRVEFNADDIAKSKVYDVKTVVEDLPPEEERAAEDAEEEEDEGGKREKADITEKKIAKKEEKEDKKNKEAAKKEQPAEKGVPGADKTAEEDGENEDEEERKFNPKTEIELKDAKLIKKTAKIGDEIKTRLEVSADYGRMAAQTAKQVIIQRLREAEREMVFNEFKDKENEVVSGIIQRREGRMVLVDLGKAVGILPAEEQIPNELYRPGERIKVYVKEVGSRPKGPEIVLSRTSDEILKKIFYLEIPEISNGLIELKAVAREAGSRSKVAVWTDSENVDPIGSCVGQRGARIQTIISELGGEKVDIIEYDEDPVKFIANALSPARIVNIETDEKNRQAKVFVDEDQLSLAIGRGGQNARLAARLTGWKVDIVNVNGQKRTDKPAPKAKDGEKDKEPAEENTEKEEKTVEAKAEPEAKPEEEKKIKDKKKKTEKNKKTKTDETEEKKEEEKAAEKK